MQTQKNENKNPEKTPNTDSQKASSGGAGHEICRDYPRIRSGISVKDSQDPFRMLGPIFPIMLGANVVVACPLVALDIHHAVAEQHNSDKQ